MNFNILYDLLVKVFKNVIPTKTDKSQTKVNCPRCAKLSNTYELDNKFNLEISLEKKLYHCWKCGIRGNLKNLFQFYGNNEIYNEYIDNFSFDITAEASDDDSGELFDIMLPKEFISFNDYSEFDDRFTEAFNYLTQTRKFKLEEIQKYNIGFCEKGYYKNRILFPTYDINNKLNYFITRTYRNNKPTYLLPHLSKEIIANENKIDWNVPVYIVEGIFDYMTIPINTTLLNGKLMSFSLLEKLKKYKPPVNLLIDADALQDAIKINNILKHNGIDDVKFIFFKENYDIDKIRVKFGKKYLINYLNENLKPLTEEREIWLKK